MVPDILSAGLLFMTQRPDRAFCVHGSSLARGRRVLGAALNFTDPLFVPVGPDTVYVTYLP